MNPNECLIAAKGLFEADKNNSQIGLLSARYPDINMDDAYMIQSLLVKKKISAENKIIGWKIGLTSKAMQNALNIDIPDSGVLLSDMLFQNGDIVPSGRFIQPRIEAEIAFVIKSDLSGKVSRSDILSATEYVCPSIEILDTRIVRKDEKTGASRTVFDTIADNAANAGIVLGNEKHDPFKFDLSWVGAIVSRNGEVEETGLGGGVLGDPILGISWLSERLGKYGDKISKGDVVLSGSFIRPIECPSGSNIRADFSNFGIVELSFD